MAERRRKKHSSKKLHISAAVLPSAAFIAVPDVPVPSVVKCIEDAPLMGALLNSAAVSRMFGSPQPEADPNLEQIASVADYEEMNDNGYLTIPFGEWTPDKNPGPFKDEVDFAAENNANGFHEGNTEAEETNQNSLRHFAHVLDETLLARNCYQSEEVEEEEIVPLVEQTKTRILESREQRTREELDEPVNQKPDRGRESHLKEEIVNLRDMVHRLNIELSKYQAKYCSAQVLDQIFELNVIKEFMMMIFYKLDMIMADFTTGLPIMQLRAKKLINIAGVNRAKKCQNIEGLPTQGPIPSWLISTKYLSPLVMEYGQQNEKLEASVAMYKKEFEKASNHCNVLITENENLHEKLLKLTSGSGHHLERSVMEQRLDLLTAENLILLEQIKSEKTNNRDVCYTQSTEIQELKDQLSLKSERCKKLEEDLLQEVHKNQELKISLDRMESENKNKIPFVEYENALDSLKKKHREIVAEHEKVKSELLAKLQSCHEEKETFLNVQSQCKDKIERMHATIKSHKAKTREYEITNRNLIEALKVTQNMEFLSQEQLQRFRLNEEIVQKILEKHSKSSEQHKQMKNKLKVYKKKLSDELSCKRESINNVRQELEIQIRQLCATLNHKEQLLEVSEADKLQMEDDMEILWQASQSENHVMRQILKRISSQCQTKSLLPDNN